MDNTIHNSHFRELIMSENTNQQAGSSGQQDGEFMLEPVSMTKRNSIYDQVMVWIGFGYVVTGLFVGGMLGGQFLITSFLGIAAQNKAIAILMAQLKT
jgi:hypothetical protein